MRLGVLDRRDLCGETSYEGNLICTNSYNINFLADARRRDLRFPVAACKARVHNREGPNGTSDYDSRHGDLTRRPRDCV